ncbi:MAG: MarR family winged helix-turn-helix transcriptional regulator [Maritimibacter sp.]
MSDTKSIASYRTPMPDILSKSGYSAQARDALMDLDAALFQWHRALVKGKFTGELLAETGVDLEPALFQGLMAITRISFGIGREAPEAPTIGMLAEEMSIDPSRASRIASDLISRALVVREAAQDDGRKSVLVLTPEGKALFSKVREHRWKRMLTAFESWDESDIETFSRLFSRYAVGLQG